jgi:RNA polymerase sigma-70 factor (sigma-E family)
MTEEEDFEHFVRANSRPLQRAAWLLCGNWNTAQDLTQVGLFAVWSHWHDIRRADAPQAYAYRAMLNAYLRTKRRKWNREVPTAEPPESATNPSETDEVELRDALLRALGHLPARQRAVLVLRYMLDLPEASVADLLDCSVGTVKSHSAKAIASLRKSQLLDDLLTQGSQP